MKILHTIKLPSGKAVTFRELGSYELLSVTKQLDKDPLHLLRMVLVDINGKAVKLEDLAGAKIDEYLSSKDATVLMGVVMSIHNAGDDDVATALETLAPSVS
jgi:hypothetical protein